MIQNNAKKPFKKWLRVTSFFTLSVFLFSSFTPPGFTAPVEKNLSVQAKRSLASLTVPESLGILEEIVRGTDGRFVILLQDAHAIPDAQKHAADLIEYFQNEYGIQRVAVEGASDIFDLQFLKSFPDKKRLKETVDAYTKRGEMTGAGIAAILSEHPSEFRGIEDWNLYETAVRLFRESLELQNIALKQVSSEKENLNLRKKEIYSPKLFEIDFFLETFQRDSKDFLEVLEKLFAVEPPKENTELRTLFNHLAQTDKTGESLLNEAKKKAEETGKILGPKVSDAGTEFNKQVQAFKVSEISPREFAVWLMDFSSKRNLGVDFSQSWKTILEDERKIRNLEGGKIFEEFETYAQGIKEKLFRNDAERNLDRESQDLHRLEEMAKLELTPKNWEAVKKRGALPGFEKYFEFYQNSEKRDEVFFSNLKAMTAGPEPVIFIGGGFHAQGLKELLKKDGISFAVVRPRISDIPEREIYLKQMRGDVSWKNYFEAENGKINLYRAFMRGMRDELLSENSDAFMLKDWRDQIVRDLAAAGKIEKSASYTRLLDEKVSAPKENGPLWLDKMNSLIEGLKLLGRENRFTPGNISKLLTPSSVLQLTGNAGFVPSIEVSEGLLGLARSEQRSELQDLKTEIIQFDEDDAVIVRPVYSKAGYFSEISVSYKDNPLGFTLHRSYDTGQNIRKGEILAESKRLLEAVIAEIRNSPRDFPGKIKETFRGAPGYRFQQKVVDADLRPAVDELWSRLWQLQPSFALLKTPYGVKLEVIVRNPDPAAPREEIIFRVDFNKDLPVNELFSQNLRVEIDLKTNRGQQKLFEATALGLDAVAETVRDGFKQKSDTGIIVDELMTKWKVSGPIEGSTRSEVRQFTRGGVTRPEGKDWNAEIKKVLPDFEIKTWEAVSLDAPLVLSPQLSTAFVSQTKSAENLGRLAQMKDWFEEHLGDSTGQFKEWVQAVMIAEELWRMAAGLPMDWQNRALLLDLIQRAIDEAATFENERPVIIESGVRKMEHLRLGLRAIMEPAATSSVLPVPKDDGSIFKTVFLPSGELLGISKANFWKVVGDKWEKTGERSGTDDKAHDIVFSIDGRKMAITRYEHVQVYEEAGGVWKQTARFTPGTPYRVVQAIAFSPDGKSIVTGGNDSTVRIWEESESGWNETARLGVIDNHHSQFKKGHTAELYAVAFSPDGKKVVSAGEDRSPRVWEKVEGVWKLSGTLPGSMRDSHEHLGPVTSVSFSPDGESVLSGSSDHTARIWRQVKGVWKETNRLGVIEGRQSGRGHVSRVITSEFSADGKQILTGGEDSTARLWEKSGTKWKQISILRTQYRTQAAFLPDGRNVRTIDQNEIRVWNINWRLRPARSEARIVPTGESFLGKIYLLNKPAGHLTGTTPYKGFGRRVEETPITLDSIPQAYRADDRAFFGQLDKETTGLILYGKTAGGLSEYLMNPNSPLDQKPVKTYEVTVEGSLDQTRADEELVTKGVEIITSRHRQRKQQIETKAIAKMVKVEVLNQFEEGGQTFTRLKVVLDRGYYRQIRQSLENIGHKVTSLNRSSVGEIKLGDLAIGQVRELSADEYRYLEDLFIAGLKAEGKTDQAEQLERTYRSELRIVGDARDLFIRMNSEENDWFSLLLPMTDGKERELLGNIKTRLNDLLVQINQLARDTGPEGIRPFVNLKTRQYSEEPGTLTLQTPQPGRRARVGVLPVSGNPMTWAHVMLGLESIVKLKLDTVIFVSAGEVAHKAVAEKDFVSSADRMKMIQAGAESFYPLLRFSDIGLRTDKVGEEYWHGLRELNSELPIDFYYLSAGENRTRAEKIMRNLAKAAEEKGLNDANKIHTLTWGVFPRSELGYGSFAQSTLDEMIRTNGVRLSSTVVDLPPFFDEISSTEYRRTHSPIYVPEKVDRFVRENRLYGAEPSARQEVRSQSEETELLSEIGSVESDLREALGDTLVEVWAVFAEVNRKISGSDEDKFDISNTILNEVIGVIETKMADLAARITELSDAGQEKDAALLTEQLEKLERIQKRIAQAQDKLIDFSEASLRRDGLESVGDTLESAVQSEFSVLPPSATGSTFFPEDELDSPEEGDNQGLDEVFRKAIFQYLRRVLPAGMLTGIERSLKRIGIGMRATVYYLEATDKVYKLVPRYGLRNRQKSSTLKVDDNWLEGLSALENYLGVFALAMRHVASPSLPVRGPSKTIQMDDYLLFEQPFGVVLHKEYQALRKLRGRQDFAGDSVNALKLKRIVRILFDLQNRMLLEKGLIVFDMNPKNIVVSAGIPALSDFDLARLIQYDPVLQRFEFYDFFNKLQPENYGPEAEEFFLLEFLEKMLYSLVQDAGDPEKKHIADIVADEIGRMSGEGQPLARMFYPLVNTSQKRGELAQIFNLEDRARARELNNFFQRYFGMNVFKYLTRGISDMGPNLNIDEIREEIFPSRSEVRTNEGVSAGPLSADDLMQELSKLANAIDLNVLPSAERLSSQDKMKIQAVRERLEFIKISVRDEDFVAPFPDALRILRDIEKTYPSDPAFQKGKDILAALISRLARSETRALSPEDNTDEGSIRDYLEMSGNVDRMIVQIEENLDSPEDLSKLADEALSALADEKPKYIDRFAGELTANGRAPQTILERFVDEFLRGKKGLDAVQDFTVLTIPMTVANAVGGQEIGTWFKEKVYGLVRSVLDEAPSRVGIMEHDTPAGSAQVYLGTSIGITGLSRERLEILLTRFENEVKPALFEQVEQKLLNDLNHGRIQLNEFNGNRTKFKKMIEGARIFAARESQVVLPDDVKTKVRRALKSENLERASSLIEHAVLAKVKITIAQSEIVQEFHRFKTPSMMSALTTRPPPDASLRGQILESIFDEDKIRSSAALLEQSTGRKFNFDEKFKEAQRHFIPLGNFHTRHIPRLDHETANVNRKYKALLEILRKAQGGEAVSKKELRRKYAEYRLWLGRLRLISTLDPRYSLAFTKEGAQVIIDADNNGSLDELMSKLNDLYRQTTESMRDTSPYKWKSVVFAVLFPFLSLLWLFRINYNFFNPQLEPARRTLRDFKKIKGFYLIKFGGDEFSIAARGRDGKIVIRSSGDFDKFKRYNQEVDRTDFDDNFYIFFDAILRAARKRSAGKKLLSDRDFVKLLRLANEEILNSVIVDENGRPISKVRDFKFQYEQKIQTRDGKMERILLWETPSGEIYAVRSDKPSPEDEVYTLGGKFLGLLLQINGLTPSDLKPYKGTAGMTANTTMGIGDKPSNVDAASNAMTDAARFQKKLKDEHHPDYSEEQVRVMTVDEIENAKKQIVFKDRGTEGPGTRAEVRAAVTLQRAEEFSRAFAEIYTILEAIPPAIPGNRGIDRIDDAMMALQYGSFGMFPSAHRGAVQAWASGLKSNFPDIMPSFKNGTLIQSDLIFDGQDRAILINGKSGAGKSSLSYAFTQMLPGRVTFGSEDKVFILQIPGWLIGASAFSYGQIRARAYNPPGSPNSMLPIDEKLSAAPLAAWVGIESKTPENIQTGQPMPFLLAAYAPATNPLADPPMILKVSHQIGTNPPAGTSQNFDELAKKLEPILFPPAAFVPAAAADPSARNEVRALAAAKGFAYSFVLGIILFFMTGWSAPAQQRTVSPASQSVMTRSSAPLRTPDLRLDMPAYFPEWNSRRKPPYQTPAAKKDPPDKAPSFKPIDYIYPDRDGYSVMQTSLGDFAEVHETRPLGYEVSASYTWRELRYFADRIENSFWGNDEFPNEVAVDIGEFLARQQDAVRVAREIFRMMPVLLTREQAEDFIDAVTETLEGGQRWEFSEARESLVSALHRPVVRSESRMADEIDPDYWAKRLIEYNREKLMGNLKIAIETLERSILLRSQNLTGLKGFETIAPKLIASIRAMLKVAKQGMEDAYVFSAVTGEKEQEFDPEESVLFTKAEALIEEAERLLRSEVRIETNVKEFPQVEVSPVLRDAVLNAVQNKEKDFTPFASQSVPNTAIDGSQMGRVAAVGGPDDLEILKNTPVYFDVTGNMIYVARGFLEKMGPFERYNFWNTLIEMRLYWQRKSSLWQMSGPAMHQWLFENEQVISDLQTYWEVNGTGDLYYFLTGVSVPSAAPEILKLTAGQALDQLGIQVIAVGDENTSRLANGEEVTVLGKPGSISRYETRKETYYETVSFQSMTRDGLGKIEQRRVPRTKTSEVFIPGTQVVLVAKGALAKNAAKITEEILPGTRLYDYAVRLNPRVQAVPEFTSPLEGLSVYARENSIFEKLLSPASESTKLNPDSNVLEGFVFRFLAENSFIIKNSFSDFLYAEILRYTQDTLSGKEWTGTNVRLVIREYFQKWESIFSGRARKVLLEEAAKRGIVTEAGEFEKVSFKFDKSGVKILIPAVISPAVRGFLEAPGLNLEALIEKEVQRYILTWYSRSKKLTVKKGSSNPIENQLKGKSDDELFDLWYSDAQNKTFGKSGYFFYEPLGFLGRRTNASDRLRPSNGVWIPGGPEKALKLVSRGMGAFDELFVPSEGLISPMRVQELMDEGTLQKRSAWKVDPTLHNMVSVTESSMGGAYYGDVVFYFNQSDLNYPSAGDYKSTGSTNLTGFTDTMFQRDLGEKLVKDNIPWSKVERIFMFREDYEKYLKLLAAQGLLEKLRFGAGEKTFQEIVEVVDPENGKGVIYRKKMAMLKTITSVFIKEYLDQPFPGTNRSRRDEVIAKTLEKLSSAPEGLDIKEYAKNEFAEMGEDAVLQALIDSGKFRIESTLPYPGQERQILIASAEDKAPMTWEQIEKPFTPEESDYLDRWITVNGMKRNIQKSIEGLPYKEDGLMGPNYFDLSLDDWLGMPAFIDAVKDERLKSNLAQLADPGIKKLKDVILPLSEMVESPQINGGRKEVRSEARAAFNGEWDAEQIKRITDFADKTGPKIILTGGNATAGKTTLRRYLRDDLSLTDDYHMMDGKVVQNIFEGEDAEDYPEGSPYALLKEYLAAQKGGVNIAQFKLPAFLLAMKDRLFTGKRQLLFIEYVGANEWLSEPAGWKPLADETDAAFLNIPLLKVTVEGKDDSKRNLSFEESTLGAEKARTRSETRASSQVAEVISAVLGMGLNRTSFSAQELALVMKIAASTAETRLSKGVKEGYFVKTGAKRNYRYAFTEAAENEFYNSPALVNARRYWPAGIQERTIRHELLQPAGYRTEDIRFMADEKETQDMVSFLTRLPRPEASAKIRRIKAAIKQPLKGGIFTKPTQSSPWIWIVPAGNPGNERLFAVNLETERILNSGLEIPLNDSGTRYEISGNFIFNLHNYTVSVFYFDGDRLVPVDFPEGENAAAFFSDASQIRVRPKDNPRLTDPQTYPAAVELQILASRVPPVSARSELRALSIEEGLQASISENLKGIETSDKQEALKIIVQENRDGRGLFRGDIGVLLEGLRNRHNFSAEEQRLARYILVALSINQLNEENKIKLISWFIKDVREIALPFSVPDWAAEARRYSRGIPEWRENFYRLREVSWQGTIEGLRQMALRWTRISSENVLVLADVVEDHPESLSLYRRAVLALSRIDQMMEGLQGPENDELRRHFMRGIEYFSSPGGEGIRRNEHQIIEVDEGGLAYLEQSLAALTEISGLRMSRRFGVAGNTVPNLGHIDPVNFGGINFDGRIVTGTSGPRPVSIIWNSDGSIASTFGDPSDSSARGGWGGTSRAITYDFEGRPLLISNQFRSMFLRNLDGTIRHSFIKPNADYPHRGNLLTAVINPDGRVLTGSSDQSAVLWNADGTVVQAFGVYRRREGHRHTGGVSAVAFAAGGQILTGSLDRTAILWTADGQIQRRFGVENNDNEFAGHTGALTAVAYSPDGLVLTGSADHTAILWNANGSIRVRFGAVNNDDANVGHTDTVTSVAFTADGHVLTTSNDNTGILWNLNGTIEYEFAGHVQAVTSSAFSPDGRILTVSLDHTAILWEFSYRRRQAARSEARSTEGRGEEKDLAERVREDQIGTIDWTWPGRLRVFQSRAIARLTEKRAAAGKTKADPVIVIDIGIGGKTREGGDAAGVTVFDLVRELKRAGYTNIIVYGVDNYAPNVANARAALQTQGDIKNDPQVKLEFREGNVFDFEKTGLRGDMILSANALFYYPPGEVLAARERLSKLIEPYGFLGFAAVREEDHVLYSLYGNDNKLEVSYTQYPGQPGGVPVESTTDDVFQRVVENRNPPRKSELRYAASVVLRLVTDVKINGEEQAEAARILAEAGADAAVRELEDLKTQMMNRLPAEVSAAMDRLAEALSNLPSNGVDIAYSVKGRSALEMKDFVDAVKRLGQIKRVLISTDEKVPEELTASLREAGVMVSRVNFKRSEIEFSGDQTYAGFVAPGEVDSSPSFVPIISLDTENIAGSDAARLVIALQTAVALLVANEISKERQVYKLKPAELLTKYKLFEGFEGAVISGDGQNIRISGAGVMAYLRYQAAQAIARSA